MNSKGITPRNEVLPPNHRRSVQRRLRLGPPAAVPRHQGPVLNKTLWAAVSVENPQTTFGGSPAAATSTLFNINNGSNYFGGDTGTLATTTTNGTVTAVSGVAPATQSVNHVPDVIGKAGGRGGRVRPPRARGGVRHRPAPFYEQRGNLKSNSLDARQRWAAAWPPRSCPAWLDVQA